MAQHSLELEDFLGILCSQVERIEATGPQDAFIVGDNKDAKIAYDLLIAHGFIAKLYQQQKNSKLYVGHARRDTSSSLEGMFAHARLLKSFKQALDDFCQSPETGVNDFTVSFVNSVGGGQLGIYLNNTVAAYEPEDAAPPPEQPVAPSRAAPSAQSARAPRGRYAIREKEETILTRPTITQQSIFATKEDGSKDPASNFMSRFFVKHIASNGVEIFLAVLFVSVILVILIMARGFICPDIAIVKSPVWYCQDFYDPVELQKYRERREQLEKFQLKKDGEE